MFDIVWEADIFILYEDDDDNVDGKTGKRFFVGRSCQESRLVPLMNMAVAIAVRMDDVKFVLAVHPPPRTSAVAVHCQE